MLGVGFTGHVNSTGNSPRRPLSRRAADGGEARAETAAQASCRTGLFWCAEAAGEWHTAGGGCIYLPGRPLILCCAPALFWVVCERGRVGE